MMISSESRWIAVSAVLLVTSHGSISIKLTDSLTAIWDIPSSTPCARQGIVIDPTPFGFAVNGQRSFDGDQIVLFYEAQLGLYPHINATGGAVNGGVPQMVNMEAHLNKAAADIAAMIPASNFTGVAVIDWESWHPLWSLNFGAKQIYQNFSRSIVRKQHPEWNATQVEKESQSQFEAATMRLMMQTLLLGRRIRPHGFWGFYGYPTCHNDGSSTACLGMAENDRVRWMFDNSSALFPSFYFHQRMPLDNIPNFVYSNMKEGYRLVNTTKPIIPFVNHWTGTAPYALLNKTELSTFFTAMLFSAVPGFVLWGSSSEVSNITGCQRLKDYLQYVIGPVTQWTLENAKLCSAQRCNDRGRCADLLQQNCICFHGSGGIDCSIYTSGSPSFLSNAPRLFHITSVLFSVISTVLSSVIQCSTLLSEITG